MEYAIVIIFVIAGIAILASIIYGLAGFIKNNNSPIETVDAKVISKRTDVTGYNNYNYSDNFNYNSSEKNSRYYVTFELSTTGERKEFYVRPNVYGTLVEGDKGFLTYQGTRFKGFDRN